MDVDAMTVQEQLFGADEERVDAVFTRKTRRTRGNLPKLTNEEYQRRRQLNLCFNCGGSHRVKDCDKTLSGNDERRG